ncbi:AbrB family transcriptional regulator [Rubellimicrobium arenae]|uniref:AbrB family transcriptional regulator n=1 Tax=Rubellimicrobium arenae TaxID=2817372 RepID=UPI0034A206FC
MAAVAQFLIGLNIGFHYIGVTCRELRRTIGVKALIMLILAMLADAVAEVPVSLASPVKAFLAFAPGAEAEVTVLAIVSGANLAYVVVHHLAPILVVILGTPLVMRSVKPRA